jgi:hypothetical protein
MGHPIGQPSPGIICLELRSRVTFESKRPYNMSDLAHHVQGIHQCRDRNPAPIPSLSRASRWRRTRGGETKNRLTRWRKSSGWTYLGPKEVGRRILLREFPRSARHRPTPAAVEPPRRGRAPVQARGCGPAPPRRRSPSPSCPPPAAVRDRQGSTATHQAADPRGLNAVGEPPYGPSQS